MRTNKKRMLMLVFSVIFVLSACAVRRKPEEISLFSESEEQQEETTGKIYLVEREEIPLEDVTELFLNKSAGEATEFYCERAGVYEWDGFQLTVHDKNGWIENISEAEKITGLLYSERNEGRWKCYEDVLGSRINIGLESNTMWWLFPEEELETCSKEEAIAACQPYAEALGYGESKVSVYAGTLDLIQDVAELILRGAPWEDYEVRTMKEYYELLDQGKTEEAEELYGYRIDGAGRQRIPWEKKHEAMIVTYQPYLDGHLMAQHHNSLVVVYVPLYGHVIYAHALMPYEVVEVLEEKPLISKSEAVAEVLQLNGYESVDEIELKDISLLYAHQITLEDGKESAKVIPCWRIDYLYQDEEKEEIVGTTMMIDAIYGGKYKEYPHLP